MKLVFSDNDRETSSGFVKDMEGGSPALKDMAVPAGLFFLQNAFSAKTPGHTANGGVVDESLYDRLLGLMDEPAKRKTRKNMKRGKKQRKTKKNN